MPLSDSLHLNGQPSVLRSDHSAGSVAGLEARIASGRRLCLLHVVWPPPGRPV